MKFSFQTSINQARRWGLLLLLAMAAAGCGGGGRPSSANPAPAGEFGQPTENRLRVGDALEVRLVTSSARAGGQPAAEIVPVIVDENGEISLPLVGRIKAGGATPSELAERIQANYVPRFYVRCNVTVQVAARFFYVGGEVRASGRYPWTEDMTLLKAINAAGSFTDYANRTKVEIVRGREKMVENAEQIRQNPQHDVPIRPGDSIWVPRSIF